MKKKWDSLFFRQLNPCWLKKLLYPMERTDTMELILILIKEPVGTNPDILIYFGQQWINFKI